MELNNFSAQSILARSMADKSIDDIEPLVSATKKMCFTSFFFMAIAQSGVQLPMRFGIRKVRGNLAYTTTSLAYKKS